MKNKSKKPVAEINWIKMIGLIIGLVIGLIGAVIFFIQLKGGN